MGKVILLSRVSSEQQDLTQQTEKVLEEIKKDGYKDEDIIVIEDSMRRRSFSKRLRIK